MVRRKRQIDTLTELVPSGTDPKWIRMRIALRASANTVSWRVPPTPSLEQGMIHLIEGLRQCALAEPGLDGYYHEIADELLRITEHGDLGDLDQPTVEMWLRQFQSVVSA